MKHPALRCTDIVYLDPAWRDKVYNFIRSTKELLPPFIRDNMVRFEHVGSMTFGNNRLASDWDFNIAMGDWNDQFTARRIFYGNIGGWRTAHHDAVMQFEKETGLRIDIGAVDCDTLKYNICVTLDDLVLHHRYSPFPEVFKSDETGIIWEQEDRPIDLSVFDPLIDEAPPVSNQHLQWNFMLHRWQRIMLNGKPGTIVPYLANRKAEWAGDEWLAELADWPQIYGPRFQSYHQIEEKLVED